MLVCPEQTDFYGIHWCHSCHPGRSWPIAFANSPQTGGVSNKLPLPVICAVVLLSSSQLLVCWSRSRNDPFGGSGDRCHISHFFSLWLLFCNWQFWTSVFLSIQPLVGSISYRWPGKLPMSTRNSPSASACRFCQSCCFWNWHHLSPLTEGSTHSPFRNKVVVLFLLSCLGC